LRIVALAGGTGSAKLLRGLAKVADALDVVANPGDNIWLHGLFICPDLDIAAYTLAGIADKTKGWGIAHDTFGALDQLAAYGEPTWFRLGDMDLATHILRTQMVRDGATLTDVSLRLCKLLGVRQRVLPASDDRLETHVVTDRGEMHLQEFWVKHGGRLPVRSIRYEGASRARPTPQVVKALSRADRIVLCPANPVTSIGPMLAMSGIRTLLARARAPVVAVSPMIGEAPFSGPAGIFLRAQGVRPDSLGVATLYRGVVDRLLIHRRDARLVPEIRKLGVEARVADTKMRNEEDEVRLARELLGP
jgi:LPPG:FO 2-phospho-L-lactate transferase